MPIRAKVALGKRQVLEPCIDSGVMMFEKVPDEAMIGELGPLGGAYIAPGAGLKHALDISIAALSEQASAEMPDKVGVVDQVLVTCGQAIDAINLCLGA